MIKNPYIFFNECFWLPFRMGFPWNCLQVLKATALTRAVMADGDSIIVQRDIRILGDGSSVLPGT